MMLAQIIFITLPVLVEHVGARLIELRGQGRGGQHLLGAAAALDRDLVQLRHRTAGELHIAHAVGTRGAEQHMPPIGREAGRQLGRRVMRQPTRGPALGRHQHHIKTAVGIRGIGDLLAIG